MNKLVDAVCTDCGQESYDVWTSDGRLPWCKECHGVQTRLWAFVRAPGITPNGTRAEVNTDPPPQLNRVDTKAIALETQREVEDKWLRFSDEAIAEEHVRREVNEAAGISDAAGNLLPVPKPDPLTFAAPAEAYA